MKVSKLSQAQNHWVELLELCCGNVERATRAWNHSPQLKALGEPPITGRSSMVVDTALELKPHAPNGYSSEAHFQAKLVERLEGLGYWITEGLKHTNGPVGITKGNPDLELLIDGFTFKIELKHGKGDLTKDQKKYHDGYRSRGGHVFTCWNDAQVNVVLAKMLEVRTRVTTLEGIAQNPWDAGFKGGNNDV